MCLWLLPLVGYWLVLVYQLGAQWSAYEHYNYGWAVPFLALYLFWQRWQTRPAAQPPGYPRLALAVVALAALLVLPARFLHEANPIWRLTSLLWALEIIGLTLALIYLVGGARWLRHFAFPVAFFAVAIPWPSGLESMLIQTLTRWNTATTIEVLGLIGIPAVQHGNVIEISTGVVGIDEACSGIRSFQATLMLALFLGELYMLTVVRRVLCVGVGFVLAFGFNVGRTGLLTWVAARDGVAAIDKWHDPAGVSILVGCFFGLWATGLWMRQRQTPPPAREATKAAAPDAKTPSVSATFSPSQLPMKLAVGLMCWLVLVEVGTEIWYRSHETDAGTAQAWTIRWPEEKPTFRRIELSDAVKKQIFFESGGQCAWLEPDGTYWQLLYFRWQPSRSLYARVRSHLNKTHRPEHCLSAGGMKLLADLGLGTYEVRGVNYSFLRYVFESNGRELRVFYGQYEDSAAPEFVTSYRENTARRVAAALAGSRNYGLRMLEIAVAGADDEVAAETAVRAQLEKLIVFEDVKDDG